MRLKKFRIRFLYGVLVVFPGCWLSILDNLVGIFTLGYYVPSLSMKWYCFVCMRGPIANLLLGRLKEVEK